MENDTFIQCYVYILFCFDTELSLSNNQICFLLHSQLFAKASTKMNTALGSTMLMFLYLASFAMAGDDCTNAVDTVPYIIFDGQQLSNHSLIDISRLGNTSETALQCITDLSTCCEDTSGRWVSPYGDEIETGGSFIVSKLSQRIELMYSGNGTLPNGIYRCEMPVIPANGTVTQSIYVGLYSGFDGMQIP